MKTLSLKISILSILTATGLSAFAHNPEKYASTSKLASGNWVKFEVQNTGMQFLSNSVISEMGIDPSKANIYGSGGRQRPEQLTVSEPDDLPLIPSEKVDGGIIFYATDYITWTPASSSSGMTYSHLMHPYSSVGYYFISDRPLAEGESATPVKGNWTLSETAKEKSTFRAHLLHETELSAPGETGRLLLGEDFRTAPAQSFNFDLPGNTGNTKVRIQSGIKISSGNASFVFTANGSRLTASSTDVIKPSSGETFIDLGSTVKEIPGNPGSLNLHIDCSLSGMVTTAALDYIEVEYDRKLSAASGWLYFHDVISTPVTFKIDGCDAQTKIWDVTDPAAPVEVNAVRDGSIMRFTETRKGMKEYIAFRPTSENCHRISANGSKRISNQDLHALGNPHMLIITPLRYSTQAEELANLHRQKDGMTVHVLSPEVIYNEFSSGTPDVGAFRKLLKMWVDRSAADSSLPYPGYCLLFAKATYDNKHLTTNLKNLGYPTLPIWQSESGTSGNTSYSTDDFIGMTDDSDAGFDISTQKIRVAVGRLPVKNETEASNIVEKIRGYVTNPSHGIWRNNVLLIADDQDNAVHMQQMDSVYAGMISQGNGNDFIYEKLYTDKYPLVSTAVGDSYPAAKERMLLKWNEGISWIQYIGHANPRGWTHEHLLAWTDIISFSNENLPFLFAATCEFANHDSDTPSGAEEMLLNPDGGIIGTICPARTVFISSNGPLTQASGPGIFRRTEDGQAVRTGDVMLYGKNLINTSDTNKLRFSLLGDPAMKVPSPENRVIVEKIGDTEVENLTDDFPVIGARGKVKVSGRIEDPDGTMLSDYNGELQFALYDAERATVTNGNGKDGKAYSFNERATRLYSGAARVRNGRWEITILMPAEIENNWSPAQLYLYAASDKGQEANGSTDKVYVYGVDPDAPEDLQGPDISMMALDHEGFESGDLTHSAPLLLAAVSDESGINLSDAGIGHKMTLTLDNSTIFSDVSAYFTPDPDKEGVGNIAYPLSGLTPGEHEILLTVWDNANNSSSRSLPFRVGLNQEVSVVELVTDCNPARDKVTFTLKTDRIKNSLTYKMEVFSLDGTLVWSSGKSSRSRNDGTIRQTWYLTDSSGSRVNRGIYLCRATVESDEGVTTSKTIKLAVTAQ